MVNSALLVRGVQMLLSTAILGLGAYLEVWWQSEPKIGDIFGFPQLPTYTLFVGAFGIVDSACGIISSTKERVPWLIQIMLDTLAATFYVTCGGVMATFVSSWRWESEDVMCLNLKAFLAHGGDCPAANKTTKAVAALDFAVFLVGVNLIGTAVRGRVVETTAGNEGAGRRVHAEGPTNGFHEK